MSYNTEEFNLCVALEPLVFLSSLESAFNDDLRASSALEELVANNSRELSANLNDVLTSAPEDLTSTPFISSEISFAPASGELYLEDRSSSPTLQITNHSLQIFHSPNFESSFHQDDKNFSEKL